MVGEIIELNEQGLNMLLEEKDRLIIVEFHTPTCPVCRSMEPVIQSIAMEFSEEVSIAKVDASRNQNMAAFYGIMGVPAFKFFCNKELLRDIQGEVNQTLFANTIKDLLKYVAHCKSRSRVFEIDGYG